MTKTARVGIDIGGTFTDLIGVDESGRLAVLKTPSSPNDYGRAFIDGLSLLLGERGWPASAVSEVIHGTTVVTNAILQRAGVITGLLTTEGFRDVLELGRIRVPVLYDLGWEKPKPLVERALRREVVERIGPDGSILRPLDLESARDALRRLAAEGVQSIAVCLLHSYVNPAHERALGQLIQELLPHVSVSLSVDVLPEIREFERTSTTVANAYVKPIVDGYLASLERGLATLGLGAPLYVMQSNGGMMTAEGARERPVFTIESGPAAGVVAAASLARELDLANVLTFDMGGTTAKASIIENGRLHETSEYEIGGQISASSRLIGGGGYLLRVPAIDVAEVGAGGGSLVWIDRGGSLRVGPRSAGSLPGPACYGRGNDQPTVTDANVVLGYLNPEALLGGQLPIQADRSRRAVAEHIARPLGLETLEAAYGIHVLANDSMGRAVRSVSVERGRDPRDFVLCAFGGNGPVHAANLATDLGIRSVLIPNHPGLFSATGLLATGIEHPAVTSFVRRALAVGDEQLEAELARLRERALHDLRVNGLAGDGVQFRYAADLRYVGQSAELQVPVRLEERTNGLRNRLVRAFGDEHRRTFGYAASEDAVEIVNLRAVAMVGRVNGDARLSSTLARPSSRDAVVRHESRRAYFGRSHGLLVTPIINRSALHGVSGVGPLIIEEYDSTIVVPPYCRAALDQAGNVLLEVDPERARP